MKTINEMIKALFALLLLGVFLGLSLPPPYQMLFEFVTSVLGLGWGVFFSGMAPFCVLYFYAAVLLAYTISSQDIYISTKERAYEVS